ncbi:hypothetical protein GOODEAATRI_027693, partial [Goodea atripinnis]
FSSSHHYFDENVCEGLPRAYIDGCAFLHEGRPQAGVGIIWVGHHATEPNHYQLGPKTSQYAEIAAVLINLLQATALDIKQLVICSDSNYARHSFISHLPVWKENGMKNGRNKEVKHSELFLACDHLTKEQGMVVYWKEVKGHSRTLRSDKDGNDEADRLARLGAASGTLWGFQKEWLPPSQTHAVCAVTWRQTKERCEDPQSSGETLHLGQKPSDTDLATMQDQDPNLHTIRELVPSGLSAETSPLATDNLEIGFMLDLPIIERANVYRLKTVLNVGFRKENTHVHLKTPSLLAYHDADPKLYLIPNLDLCTKTKDLHWLCPSNPFIRDVTDYMCCLREGSPEQNC